MARTPGATTPGKQPIFRCAHFTWTFHPIWSIFPGKRLIFTDMDMEDESPRPEASRDNKDAPSSDSEDSDLGFAAKPQCLAARLAFDAFSDDDFWSIEHILAQTLLMSICLCYFHSNSIQIEQIGIGFCSCFQLLSMSQSVRSSSGKSMGWWLGWTIFVT